MVLPRLSSHLWFLALCTLVASTNRQTPPLSGSRHITGYSGPSRKSNTACRLLPSDPLWPSPTLWSTLNTTLSGRLLFTTPLAAPCHSNASSSFGPYDYDAVACAAIRSSWDETATHTESSSSVMSQFFANQSCEPFYPAEAPCEVGSYVQYAVNLSTSTSTAVRAIQTVLSFVHANNVRLVIRNTGHDYLGKSTGKGGLALWTHYLKEMALIREYASAAYEGPAIRFGAGVQALEAYEFAREYGLVVVGGNCQSVGLAGGYTQGGGHSALSSVLGLAADQVLEWEVVIGTGELVIARPGGDYEDLYWALSGGGGGTFGVVVSMTVRAHKGFDRVAGANMTFEPLAADADADLEGYYDVVRTFVEQIPGLIDAGAALVWWVTPASFALSPATGPALTAAQLDGFFAPVLEKLDEYGMQYTYESHDFGSFLEENLAMDLPYEISNLHMGGRFVRRDVLEGNLTGLMDTIRGMNGYGAVVSGISVNASLKEGFEGVQNAVNPYWRDTPIDVVVGMAYNFTDWGDNLRKQHVITETLGGLLEDLTGTETGAYLNEADYRMKHWKEMFYGVNWERLSEVKRKYDPEDVFYARTGVGSERWKEDGEGRLCRIEDGE